MKVFYDALKRTIDNGTYAAMYDDTVALDNAMTRKLLTQQEHDDLVAYWHEKYDAAAADETPAAEPPAGSAESSAGG